MILDWPLYCINTLFNFYLYSATCIILSAWFGFDFGLQRLYISALDKLFKFIETNETLFLRKKPSPEVKVDRSKSSSAKDQVLINGYTKDEIDQCFTAKAPNCWNILTSTWRRESDSSDHVYEPTLAGKFLYTCGTIFRFGLLFPIRLMILIHTLLQTLIVLFIMAFVLPSGKFRCAYYSLFWKVTFRCANQALGGLFIYHGTHNCHKAGGIAVANHTGPLDIIGLADHVRYSFLGRQRNGILGHIYKAIEEVGSHIWFTMEEKETVKGRLQARVENPISYPLIIFPEGTCTTTDRILRFKKGSFELDCSVYPIAIKYDLRFGNPFWNSKTIGFLGICIKFLTNWAIVADVKYLAPVNRKASETAIDFSERVRGLIANQIGLKKIDLDGYTVKYSSGAITQSTGKLVPEDKIGSKTFSTIANQSFKLGASGDWLNRSY